MTAELIEWKRIQCSPSPMSISSTFEEIKQIRLTEVTMIAPFVISLRQRFWQIMWIRHQQ